MIRPPKPPDDIFDFSRTVGATANRPPVDLFILDDNLDFHASRLVLLIAAAGRPGRNPRIEGRTKLAKLDFFVRYPRFLKRAILISGSESLIERSSVDLNLDGKVESHMLRYKYGPWDHRYYTVLAYLLGKRVIEIKISAGIDNFSLSERGEELRNTLLIQDEWQVISARCSMVGELFGDRTGTYIKDFVYRHFPEVVHAPYSSHIFQGSVSEMTVKHD